MTFGDDEGGVPYRILAIVEKDREVGFGVAYEKDGRILLFAPNWRGVRALSAASLAALDRGHFPSQGAAFRWGEIGRWADRETFHPLAALSAYDAASADMGRRNMQSDMTLPRGTGRRARPQPRPSPARRLLRSPALAVILAVVVVGAALGLFWRLANPPLGAVPPGPPVYIREIYIVLDTTGSMTKEDVAAAKEIVETRIFPNLGPGDRVFCYGIGSGFVESRARIFGQEALPGVPENLLDENRAARVPAPAVQRMRAQVPPVIQEWTRQLENFNTSGPDFLLSNYYDAFTYFATRFKTQGDAHLRERRLIVIGDLYEDPPPTPFEPPPPGPEERSAFGGLEVFLIHPYRAEQRQTAPTGRRRQRRRLNTQGRAVRAEELLRFWRTYFAQRGNERVRIQTFDDPTPPVPRSPVLDILDKRQD